MPGVNGAWLLQWISISDRQGHQRRMCAMWVVTGHRRTRGLPVWRMASLESWDMCVPRCRHTVPGQHNWNNARVRRCMATDKHHNRQDHEDQGAGGAQAPASGSRTSMMKQRSGDTAVGTGHPELGPARENMLCGDRYEKNQLMPIVKLFYFARRRRNI